MAYKNPEDHKEFMKKHYRENKEYYKEKRRRRSRELRAWFREYKSNLSCSQCKESHPACIEFHHRDPTQKDLELSHAVKAGWGKDRILKEVAKCDVLCANCHRKLHAEERTPP